LFCHTEQLYRLLARRRVARTSVHELAAWFGREALRATISGDGKRLVLNDLTADAGGTFSVASTAGGAVAEDLGIDVAASGDIVTGRRIIGSLQGPLLSSLEGGIGLATLGGISLTDRGGASTTVDLSGAETLRDVVDRLNNSGIGIRADINDARGGIVLRDTTGATSGNLIVANVADGTNTADALGLTVDAAQTTVDGGPLHLQTVFKTTRLDDLNNGSGVQLGSIMITDSQGNTSGVNLRTAEAETVGDVLDLINGLGLGLEARMNNTGDGIALVDTAGGGVTMKVEESGTGRTAADLKLLGAAAEVDIGGTPTQVIDGTMSSELSISGDDTLQDVVDKINALDMGVTAGILHTGNATSPYHLTLTSDKSGRAGEIRLDTSQFEMDFWELAPAQDAVLQIGSADVPGAGILATSSNNEFSEVVEGLKLTLGGVSNQPVTISVSESDETLVGNAKLLVDQYNKLHQKIEELTFFDAQTETTGLLAGSHETLQIEMRLTRIMTGRFFGAGSIQSLQQVGIGFNEDGQLQLDEFKLRDQFAEDPEAVKEFFTEQEFGFVAKLNKTIEALAGEGESLLIGRSSTLQRKVESYNDRIEFYNERLERERERLLKYYYKLELAISKIKSSQSALSALQPIAPAAPSNGNSTVSIS